MRFLAPLLILFLLPACAGNVSRLREKNPQAEDFQSSLASEYQSYADSEMELYRMFSANYYAGKGLKALQGENVAPDYPKERLSAAKKQELLDARAQLMRLLNDEMKQSEPQKLARAQLLYDCWQHEIDRGIEQEQAPCGAEFHSTVQELQDMADAKTYARNRKYVVEFPSRSTALTAQGKAVIKDVAAAVVHMEQYSVQLMVYTGRKASQRRLTDERLANVRSALIKAGVHEHRIHMRKVGGSKVVILSRDGIAMNTRKITITVKTNGGKRKPQPAPAPTESKGN